MVQRHTSGTGTIHGVAQPNPRIRRSSVSGLVSQARRRLVPRPIPNGAAAHLVVCGDDPLTYRLVESLVVRERRAVTVVLPSKRRNHGPNIARIRGVRVVEAERLDAEAFGRAEIVRAEALALVAQDDIGNLHAALLAQELNPDLRLVVRMFNMRLGNGVRLMVRRCSVLSDAEIAAPAVVAATLGEVAPAFVRLPDRTLLVAARSEVSGHQVVCGLARTAPDRRHVLLPADQDQCDLVLALADGAAQQSWARTSRWVSWWRRPLGWVAQARQLVNGTLRITVLVLLCVVMVGTAVLVMLDPELSVWGAFYLTMLDTVGGGDPETGASTAVQAIQVAVMVAGISMVPVVTAAVVDVVVNTRLAMAAGRLRKPMSDHVVVVGLGNLGTRVIEQLRDLGVPVVGVDRTDQARGVQAARDLDIPLLIGDASQLETLHEAGVARAGAVALLSTDDAINLEAALHARSLNPDLRVVLRLFDGDFAARVQHVFAIAASTSISQLAVPAFTAAMLGSEVIGTIPVDREVLVVARVRVEPGARLAGSTVGAAILPGEALVIALSSGAPGSLIWAGEPDRQLCAGDRLIVVATRDGLGKLQAAAEAEPATHAGAVNSSTE